MFDNRRCGNCRNCVSSQYEFQDGMKENVAVKLSAMYCDW